MIRIVLAALLALVPTLTAEAALYRISGQYQDSVGNSVPAGFVMWREATYLNRTNGGGWIPATSYYNNGSAFRLDFNETSVGQFDVWVGAMGNFYTWTGIGSGVMLTPTTTDDLTSLITYQVPTPYSSPLIPSGWISQITTQSGPSGTYTIPHYLHPVLPSEVGINPLQVPEPSSLGLGLGAFLILPLKRAWQSYSVRRKAAKRERVWREARDKGMHRYKGLLDFAQFRGYPLGRVNYPDGEKSIWMALGNAFDYAEMFGGTVEQK